MKHGREDYNGRIVDLAALSLEEVERLWQAAHTFAPGQEVPTPIGKAEPVFVLRASDLTAPLAVEHYATLQYRRKGATREHGNSAMQQAYAMAEWQAAHPTRVKGGDV